MKLNYDTADKNMKLLGQSVLPNACSQTTPENTEAPEEGPFSPASSYQKESKELYSLPWKSNYITRNQFHT